MWVPVPSSALASHSVRAITTPQSSEPTFQQQQQQKQQQQQQKQQQQQHLVQQYYAEAKLERRGQGRELYIAGTAEVVTLSATSAASSSMPGSSAAVSQTRLNGVSDAAALDSVSCEDKSKLVQAGAPDAMQGLRLDRAAGVQVRV